MREICTSGSMSGDVETESGATLTTAPLLDSTMVGFLPFASSLSQQVLPSEVMMMRSCLLQMSRILLKMNEADQ